MINIFEGRVLHTTVIFIATYNLIKIFYEKKILLTDINIIYLFIIHIKF